MLFPENGNTTDDRLTAGLQGGDRRLLYQKGEMIMIRKIFALALVLALTASLAACTATVAAGDQTGTARSGGNTSRSGGTAGGERISEEKAQEIALKHAGLKADQVTGIRVSYDVDDGVPEYEVEFRYDGWEYEYEIHAETGEIRSYDRDD